MTLGEKIIVIIAPAVLLLFVGVLYIGYQATF